MSQIYKQEPSLEQKTIIRASKSYDVVVNAVAGSGKTTTVREIGRELPQGSKLLLVTYSSRLKEECRVSIRNNKLESKIATHSFHSLYYRYYGTCTNDQQLEWHIKSNSPIVRPDQFDVIVLDEVQDMTRLLYQAIKKFVIDIQYSGRLIVLGDVYQSIFNYMGSDARFLSCARDVFNRSFINLKLTASFRLTPPMCYFINEIVLRQQWMTSGKKLCKADGTPIVYPRVDYYRGNFYSVYNRIGKMMSTAINNGKWKVEDIFVLAPSPRHQGLVKIANILTKNGIPNYYHNSDSNTLQDKYTSNKVVLTTYNSSKGLERSTVIVCGFDADYFKYYNKDADQSICPEVMYVALTRASYRLIVVNSYEDDTQSDVIPFIDASKLYNSEFINLQNNGSDIVNSSAITPEASSRKSTVTNLVKYLPNDDCTIMRILLEQLESYIPTYNDGVNFSMPLDVTREYNGKIITEYVGNINAIAVTFKHCKTHGLIQFGRPVDTVDQYLEQANICIAHTDGINTYLKQIPPYDWLVEQHLDIGCSRLNTFLNSVGINKFNIEQPVGGSVTSKWITQWNNRIHNIEVSGSIDILHYNNDGTVDIIEVKCVQQVLLEHKLQLIIYGWLWSIDPNRSMYRVKNLYLFSIITNECIHVRFDIEIIRSIINHLFSVKYNPPTTKSNIDFLRMLRES